MSVSVKLRIIRGNSLNIGILGLINMPNVSSPFVQDIWISKFSQWMYYYIRCTQTYHTQRLTAWTHHIIIINSYHNNYYYMSDTASRRHETHTSSSAVSASRCFSFSAVSALFDISWAFVDLDTAPSWQLSPPPHLPQPAPPQTLSHGSPRPSQTWHKQDRVVATNNN